MKDNKYMKNFVPKPIVFYLDLVLSKKVIFKDNRDKSGVYRWNNLITGASYVGSAINLSRRLRDYFSSKFINKEILKNNSIIYKALLKYGYSNFSLDIIEYCDKISVIEREQYYIDLLKPEYNLCLKAGSSLGRVTKETTRLKLRNVWLNRLFSKSKYDILKEFIIKSIDRKLDKSRLSIIKLYKEFSKIKLLKESKVSFDTRMKILASTRTRQIVLVTDMSKGITNEYSSARRAAEALNASNSTVINKLKGKNTGLYKSRYLITRGFGYKSNLP
jgi:group I intron endonuclease